MLKPVTLLALDDASASLAAAVQRRIAAHCGLDDLAQWRLATDVAAAVTSVHARRQDPDSPLRMRDDVSRRELVLLIASCTTKNVADVARAVRQVYELRRLAAIFSVEALILMPDLFAEPDYGAAYSLLKVLSEMRALDEIWLLDATNANRVKFGQLDSEAYAQAVAGMLTLEPEMSGAPASTRPRGMAPCFSSFGYAELVFPRDAALQRLEPRFAAELIREKLLAAGPPLQAQLAAKQFVVGEEFARPLSRIGVDAGLSLFQRFQAKTLVTEKTRSADEVIVAVRNEVKAHREQVHAETLRTLHANGEEAARAHEALLTRVADATLDRHGYAAAVAFTEALVDPTPDLRDGTDVAPRNVVTELHTANASLDPRLRFVPNTAASSAARKRIRELDSLLHDQRLIADAHAPAGADAQLAAMEEERRDLLHAMPALIFAEEAENNAARNEARDAETARLAAETLAKEQQLRELFAQKPRAEQALREALEARRSFLTWQVVIVAVLLAGAWFHKAALGALGVYAIYILVRYFRDIAPAIRNAREQLARLLALIDSTDKAKNAAHDDELRFEHDVALRRTTLSVLGRAREAAERLHDSLRARYDELLRWGAGDTAAEAAAPVGGSLSFAILDDADIDAYYDRTVDDRRPHVREFPIARSESRRLALDVLRERIAAYAATGFASFRALTLGKAIALAEESRLARRFKRFVDASAPLIELGEDLDAQRAMQRDLTVWMESTPALTSLVQRRLADAQVRPPEDPLRLQVVSRVLHFPAYVIGPVGHYRERYDAARFPESANVPDIMPAAILLGAHRQAYEQILLGRAVGVIRLRRDGQLAMASLALGDSHLAAAQRMTPSQLQDLERALEPRLTIAGDVERELRQLLDAKAPLTELDRTVIGTLLTRYRPELA